MFFFLLAVVSSSSLKKLFHDDNFSLHCILHLSVSKTHLSIKAGDCTYVCLSEGFEAEM